MDVTDVSDALIQGMQEDDDGDEYDRRSFAYYISLLFPDLNPLLWLIIHLGIVLLYFIMYLELKEHDTLINGALLSIAFVCLVNYTLLLALLILRDDELANGGFSAIILTHKDSRSIINIFNMGYYTNAIMEIINFYQWESNTYSIYFFCINTSEYLTFHKSSQTWISLTIYLCPILSLRTLCFSIIKTIFEAGILMVCNEPLGKYIKMYKLVRKLNYAWLKYVLTQKDAFRLLEEGVRGNRMVCRNILDQIDVKKKKRKSKAPRYRWNSEDSAHILDLEKNDFADDWGKFARLYLNSEYTTRIQVWFVAYHISEMAPIIHLLHQEVELRGRDAINSAFETFFNQIYATTTTTSARPDSERSPRNIIPCTIPIVPTLSRPIEIKEQVARQVLANAVRQSSIKLEMQIPDESQIKGKNVIFMWCLKYMRKLLGFSTEEKEMVCLSERLNRAAFQFNEISHPYSSYPEANIYLSASNFKLFLNEQDAMEMIYWFDCSGHGKIDSRMFSRKLSRLIYLRKKFKHNIKGQESVFKVMSRLVSSFLWILTGIIIAIICGVEMEVIVASCAAFLSAMTVSLSYLYTNFISSVIFVAVSNPYNVDDLIRLNDGEPLWVRKIRTYSSEFISMQGKVIIIQNSTLAGMKITNESRAANAIFEIPLKLDFYTTPESMSLLEQSLKEYINGHPSDFVKDFVLVFISEFHVGFFFEIRIWIKCVEGWGNWRMLHILRTNFIEFMLKRCRELSITYRMPDQKLIFPESLSLCNYETSPVVPVQLPTIPTSLPIKPEIHNKDKK